MAKTIKITRLIEKANDFFKNSPDAARMDRIHVADFVSSVLHETGNYAGFGYLRDYHDPANDSSRIFYYVSRKLEA